MPSDDVLPDDTRQRTRFDAPRARKLARDPLRPGERCRGVPATYELRIDRSRCEGKSDCVAVCPYDVFEVRRMDDIDYRSLSVFARLKSLAHRRLTAYAVRGADCHACGLCVIACPERAITLVQVP